LPKQDWPKVGYLPTPSQFQIVKLPFVSRTLAFSPRIELCRIRG
jgi:hypothetical protein